ncbi:MAG TPA: AMP-binding protein [Trueperaceae bacterium]|nr:AMP-binding protein [Trueperaceae bacterium]
MNIKSLLMPVYRRVPAPLKELAGTLYGRYLSAWRYGPETEQLAAEARARESWDAAAWRAYSEERLSSLLRDAAEHVPYYREAWRRRRAAGDTSPVEDLASWPVLTKAEVRRRPEAFLRDDAKPSSLFKLMTSGTTGTPVTVWRDRAAMRAWYAFTEARWRGWYGVTRHDPWAMLGGQEVVPVEQDTPPFWVWNAAGHQLYLSNLHVKRKNAPAYLEAMRHHAVVHAYGYSSSLAELARYAVEDGLEAPRLKVVVTNAEPLLPWQREVIGRAFGCAARESYGMTEAVAGASECEHGVLHLWPDAGHVEVVDDDADAPVAPGETGRLLCTGLLNTVMPLVRYEVGDRGAVVTDAGRCACGRDMPRLTALEGRSTDNLVTADGRRVFWVNPVFYGLPLHEAQVVQVDLGRLVVNVVPAEGFGEEHERAIATGLRQRLGDVAVEVRRLAAIPRGPNGKFRAVVSHVTAAQGRGEGGPWNAA